jgi:hypothetical protein
MKKRKGDSNKEEESPTKQQPVQRLIRIRQNKSKPSHNTMQKPLNSEGLDENSPGKKS